MGFWSGVFKTLDAVGKAGIAHDEAERLAAQSPAVARRQLVLASRDADDDRWHFLINALDQIARTSTGKKAEFAAALAEYGESLRRLG